MNEDNRTLMDGYPHKVRCCHCGQEFEELEVIVDGAYAWICEGCEIERGIAGEMEKDGWFEV